MDHFKTTCKSVGNDYFKVKIYHEGDVYAFILEKSQIRQFIGILDNPL